MFPLSGFVVSSGWLGGVNYTISEAGARKIVSGAVQAGKLFALAAVAVDINSVLIEIHGIHALHAPPAATRIELPTFRDAAGRSEAAIILPDEGRGPIGDAVLDQLVEVGPCCEAARIDAFAVRTIETATLVDQPGLASSVRRTPTP